MISNFKLFPYFNISQNFIQNVQKKKNNLCPELAQFLGPVTTPPSHDPWGSRGGRSNNHPLPVIPAINTDHSINLEKDKISTQGKTLT